MACESEVVEVPPNTQVEVRPTNDDDELCLTSIVTETALGIRFRDDIGLETALKSINEENLSIETYIDRDNYMVFETGDSNKHKGFYSAVDYDG